MKKIILSIVLLTTTLTFSQEKPADSTKTKKVTVETFVGFSANINDKVNLNKKLQSANLPEMNSFIPELTIGLNIFGKKYSGDIAFGLLFSRPEKGNNEMKYQGFSGKIRTHYNVVNKEKIAFTTGLSLAYQTNEYDIYSKDNSIDLNNLEPNNNSGHVNINNSMLYFGPSASLYLFKNSNWKVRLDIGYEFALTRGRYHSEFGSILNNVGESGNNRVVFGILLL